MTVERCTSRIPVGMVYSLLCREQRDDECFRGLLHFELLLLLGSEVVASWLHGVPTLPLALSHARLPVVLLREQSPLLMRPSVVQHSPLRLVRLEPVDGARSCR